LRNPEARICNKSELRAIKIPVSERDLPALVSGFFAASRFPIRRKHRPGQLRACVIPRRVGLVPDPATDFATDTGAEHDDTLPTEKSFARNGRVLNYRLPDR